jgi:glycosyltransferase involved in cell wall biosynthesis
MEELQPRLRIALIAPPWLPVPPTAYGGTEGVIDRLARGYHAAGHEVLLYTTGDSTCPVPKAWIQEKAEPEQLGQLFVILHHLVNAYETVADFDIIHDHTTIGSMYGNCRANGKIVTTNHGPFGAKLNDIYQRMVPQPSLIAISHDQASHSTVPVDAVIHHGVGLDEFPFGAGDGGYFVFLGRFHPDKGAREAILAANEAGVELLLAAKMREPVEIEHFHTEIKPLLGRSVKYLGEIGMQEKVELLQSAKALLNPIQWSEPFGLVMIEALACGTPVLSYRAGSAPEIVDHGKTGFLCDGMADLVTAIRRVDELDRAACRQAVAERFTTDRMVADHLALFERLLEEGSDDPPMDTSLTV